MLCINWYGNTTKTLIFVYITISLIRVCLPLPKKIKWFDLFIHFYDKTSLQHFQYLSIYYIRHILYFHIYLLPLGYSAIMQRCKGVALNIRKYIILYPRVQYGDSILKWIKYVIKIKTKQNILIPDHENIARFWFKHLQQLHLLFMTFFFLKTTDVINVLVYSLNFYDTRVQYTFWYVLH